jgi:hypothetical protein
MAARVKGLEKQLAPTNRGSRTLRRALHHMYKLDSRALAIFVGAFMMVVAIVTGAGRQWGVFSISLVVLAVCLVGLYRTHKRRKGGWADQE